MFSPLLYFYFTFAHNVQHFLHLRQACSRRGGSDENAFVVENFSKPSVGKAKIARHFQANAGFFKGIYDFNFIQLKFGVIELNLTKIGSTQLN